MEESEVPLEQVQEHIEHHAHLSQEKWVSLVALSTAILAALAAVASLQAGDHANEAMITQMQASDQWAFYQAKGIKSGIVEGRTQIMQALGKVPLAADVEKLEKYRHEQEEIKGEAEAKAAESMVHLRKHKIMARSVTLFQVAIAVAAISVLTKRRRFWIMSLILGAAGLCFLGQSMLAS